jgi:hypothetical protein
MADRVFKPAGAYRGDNRQRCDHREVNPQHADKGWDRGFRTACFAGLPRILVGRVRQHGSIADDGGEARTG